MADVINLRKSNPVKDLSEFFRTMFGSQRGFIYCPTKLYAKDPVWETHFFLWPQDEKELIEHVLTKAPTHEVYYAPVLLKQRDVPKRDRPENFAGSYWVWCEFDYGIPKPEKLNEYQIPQPQVRVRTSEPGHEHWYWRIGDWQEDPEALRGITQRLAYALNADSCFDWGRVLRVPYTIHHDTKMAVQLLNSQGGYNAYETFANVPEVEHAQIEDVDLGPIPALNETLLKYAFPPAAMEIFLRKKEELEPKDGKPGKRSSAILRLGHELAEIGMTNEEIYTVIKNCDDRWGKYSTLRTVPHGKDTPAPDRQLKELVKIINIVRKKHPYFLPDDLTKDYPVMGIIDMLKAEVHIEWVIPDLIHKKSLWLLTGPPASGKTTVAAQLCCEIALGRELFDRWSAGPPQKTIFFSMEMSLEESKELMNDILTMYSEEEQEILNENFKIIPIGTRIPLNRPKYQEIINAIVDQHEPTGVIFDSLGIAIDDKIESAEVMNNVFAYLKEHLNSKRGIHVGFIHHHTKEQDSARRKPKSAHHIFGSQYIVANVRSIITLWPIDPEDPDTETEIYCLKMSLKKPWKGFRLKHRDGFGYDVVNNGRYNDDVSDEELDEATGFDNDRGGKPDNDARGFDLG